MLNKPSSNSPVQVLYQQIRGSNICVDLADTGGGVQSLGKPADVILESSLLESLALHRKVSTGTSGGITIRAELGI